jgi:hypothetical protein
MKVHEYREMMRYLTRKPLSDREVELAYTDHIQKLNAPAPMPATSGEDLGTRKGFKDGNFPTGFEHRNFIPLTKEQREIAKTVYGLKESEVDDWQSDLVNKAKKKNIQSGLTTLKTKAANLNPDRIIVSAPKGSEEINDVIFPDKKTEKSFLKDLKERFTLSQGQSEKNIKYFSENYPISERQATRAIKFLSDKYKLKYSDPLTKPEIREKLKNLREVTSDITTEDYITKKIKQPILKEKDLVKKIDLAHRVSKEHMKQLGLQFSTRTTGFDSRLINQVIIKPSEESLEKLYRKQRNIIDDIKQNGLTEELSGKLEDINNKVRIEAKKTNGRLIGVTVDPETLDVSFEGKKAKLGLTDKVLDIKEIAEMSPDKKVKFLTNQITPRIQAEIDRGFTPNDFKEILSDPKREKSLIKYAEKYTPDIVEDVKKIIKNPTSTKSLPLYADPTGIGTFLETGFGQALSKTAPNLLKATAKLSTVTGTPLNAVLGVAFNADEFKEMGLGDLETIAAGAYKGSTQDLLNFGDLIFRKLPVATYEKFVEDKPFLESLLDKPEYFEFADKQINKYTSAKSIKDRIQNRAEFEVRKSIPINTSETEVPTITTEEYNNLVENKKNEILNANPNLKQLYEGEVIQQPKPIAPQQSMLGPIVFPKYTQEELNFARGGRVKFAEGSDDPESDLYIPPLNKEGISGTNVPKEGIRGLYFGFKEDPRTIPMDPVTGKPITSGGTKELKQIFSSLLSNERPEIGYADEKFNFNISKGINPYTSDRSTKYEASYKPEGDSGVLSLEKTPQYLGAGYTYQKDGLDFGITGLKNQMGDKSIALRFGYNYATGGRVGFSGGGGANFLKMLRNISDSLLGIKNSTHILGNTARFNGITKAAEEALTPYINIPNQNKHTTVLESIKKAKENLPKEYHGILDEMKSYADKHAYDAVDDMAKALDKIIDPNLKFESLPQNIFPMEDPLNSAFIIMDPQRNNMRGRFVNRVKVDPETGRGTRETFDTFDSKTRTFLKEEDWKPVGVESLEKGKEGLN